jgi:hypothetical protein
MKRDVELAPIFADNNVCLLDAYAMRTTRVPPRQFGSISVYASSTSLAAMTSRTLSLRLDGATHSFEEARGAIRYVGSSGETKERSSPKLPTGRYVGRAWNKPEVWFSGKPVAKKPETLELESCDPPRMISIRRITTRHAMTLLLIDDILGKAISVIGDAITWSLDGLDVQLVTDSDNEVARI